MNGNKSNTIENKTGIHKLNCNNCGKFYLGQSGRTFKKMIYRTLANFRD